MYNFSQRFTALLLLFSIILQSCYTPLKMTHKKHASSPKVLFKPDKDSYPNDSASLKIVQSEISWLQDENEPDNSDTEAQVIEYEKTDDQESPVSSQANSEGYQSQEDIPTVFFYQKDGVWKAKLEETSGSIQRSEDLDVVCAPVVDVEALNHMPKAQSKQLIHRIKHPEQDFIYLGKMGLSGGMSGIASEAIKEQKMEEKEDKEEPYQLHEAVKAGNITEIEKLIHGGYDVNETRDHDQSLSTPLHLAVFNNHPEVVSFLLENGANPNLLDIHRRTPLQVAVDHGYDKIVGLLQVSAHNSLSHANLGNSQIDNFTQYSSLQEAVQALIVQRNDLDSTAALVEAFNNVDSQDPVAKWLVQWLEKYIERFENKTSLNKEEIEEYKNLAHIQPKTSKSKELAQRYLFSLANKVQLDLHGETTLVEALDSSLRILDIEVFEKNSAELTKLCNTLLDKLDTSKIALTQAAYPTFLPILYALQQAMLLIQFIDPGQWDISQEENSNTLYNRFEKGFKDIGEKGKAYYPYVYQSLVLQQILQSLKKDVSSWKVFITRLGKGAKGLIYTYKVVRSLVLLDVDINSLEKACNNLKQILPNVDEVSRWLEEVPKDLKKAFKALPDIFDPTLLDKASENIKGARGKKKSKPKTWYDKLQTMHSGTIMSLRDYTKYEEVFSKPLKDLKDNPIKNKADRKALYYGVIQLLRKLALESHNPALCQKSIDHLKELSCTKTWTEDLVIMEELLKSLASVVQQNQAGDKKALESLQELRDNIPTEAPSGRRLSFESIRRICGENNTNPTYSKKEIETINSWKVWQILYEKREEKKGEEKKEEQENVARSAPAQMNKLYSKVIESLGVVIPMDSKEVQQHLKNFYTTSNFCKVAKLLDEAEQPIEKAQFQLLLLEQKPVKEDQKQGMEGEEENGTVNSKNQVSEKIKRLELVKTPIELADLFKERSIQEETPAKKVHKVLLVGEPGTGKTTVSHKLAYTWAKGNWESSFRAVYVLPVRELKEQEYGNKHPGRKKRLAKAIADICFPSEVIKNEKHYEQLQARILGDLDCEDTLLVLDGLDEGIGASNPLLEEAQSGKHKLLIISRPYGLEEVRKKVDIEIEHAGFSDKQIEEYVNNCFLGLGDEKGRELLKFLKQSSSLKFIAHVPVNLCILCALWKEDPYKVQAVKGSLTGLYEKMIKHVWDRYAKKVNKDRPQDLHLQNKERNELFGVLGQFALKGLEIGEQGLISTKTVSEVLDNVPTNEKVKEMLKDSGLLLWQKAGNHHQFPHLTFQEYFAGKELARQFFSKKAKEQESAKKFLAEHKYQRQYQVTLSFMAGEISKDQGQKGIVALLKELNSGPQEVIGLHHLLLQLRCLNEYLCLYEGELEAIDEEFQCMSRLASWFEQGIRMKNNQHFYYLLTSALQGMPVVAKEARDVLEVLLKAAKDDYITTCVLGEFAKIAPAYADELFQRLLYLATFSNTCVCSAAVHALVEVTKVAPKYAEKVCEVLLNGLNKDKYLYIYTFYQNALLEFVKVAPEHAEKVCEAVLSVSKDTDPNVRRFVINFLFELVRLDPKWVKQSLVQALLDQLLDVDRWSDIARKDVVRALIEVAKVKSCYSAKVYAAFLDVFLRVTGKGMIYYFPTRAFGELIDEVPMLTSTVLQGLLDAMNHKEGIIRSHTTQALGELGQLTPEDTSRVTKALLDATNDSDYSVHSSAIQALGAYIRKDPGIEEEVHKVLLNFVQRGDEFVRSSAINCFVELAKVFPEQVETIYKIILQSAKECPCISVRLTAASALVELVKILPNHAKEVCEVLLVTPEDKFWHARQYSNYDFVKFIKVAPAYIKEVLKKLLDAVKNEDWYVSHLASCEFIEFIKVAPECAPEALNDILIVIRQKNQDNYQGAMRALDELIKAAPEHVSEMLPTLMQSVKDNDQFFSYFATSVLKEIPLPQLIQGYFDTKDKALIPYILHQAWHSPIVVQYNKNGYQDLLAYTSSEGPNVLGNYSVQEVQKFMQLVKTAQEYKKEKVDQESKKNEAIGNKTQKIDEESKEVESKSNWLDQLG
jgi:hypothetical protein